MRSRYPNLFVFFLSFIGLFIPSHIALGQRYVALQMLNLDESPDGANNIINGALDQGCNLVNLTIYWDMVYPTATSSPDWRQPDQQIALVTARGAKVSLRIMLARRMNRIEGFWTNAERPQDFNYKPLEGIYGRTSFSLAHQPTVDKAAQFVKTVCQRYSNLQNEGKLLFVSVVNTPIQELGHHYNNYPEGDWQTSNPREFLTVYDYCPSAASSFRLWLKNQYKTLSKLNYHWKRQETTWDNLKVPQTYDNQLALYQSRMGKDWYLYSHYTLRSFIHSMISAIKSVNPNFKVINEYGAVIDQLSPLRNTLGFRDLDQQADGTKINNDISYDHRFMMDVVRSNRPNVLIMNEVFYDGKSSNADYIKQFDECFERGANMVSFVLATYQQFELAKTALRTSASRWINQPLASIKPQEQMSYSMSEVLDNDYKKVFNNWQIKAGSSRQPVQINLNEDLLSDEYWKPIRNNVLPIVKQVIPERAVKINRAFTYKIPDNTFADLDGEVVRIEAINLPVWLKFENNELSGTAPNSVAEYNIRLRAIDDENGIVETNFKLSVVNNNLKPVLTSVLPTFQIYLEQLVVYKISTHFNDPDGKIVRYEATGLQPWMSLDKDDFIAFARTYGTFTITIRAYDEDETWVEGSFVVKVLNRPPQVKNAPAVRSVSILKNFRYPIDPNNIFADSDGKIERVRLLGLANWMTFQDNVLSGTPSTLGDFNLILRAYDNGGDSVQVPIIIRVVPPAPNTPPTIRKKIPDSRLFITQNYNYPIIEDSLFTDANGFIDKIEIKNLPSWLIYKNGSLSGQATQSGISFITITATDDEAASVSFTFTITVIAAPINFELLQAGKAGTRKSLGNISNGAILQAETLPERINIHSTCELATTEMQLTLTGPYRKSGQILQFPYSLFNDETGFVPYAGSYTLKAVAMRNEVVLNTATIQFTIKTNQSLSDWSIYPNPMTDVCSIKLPNNTNAQTLRFSLVNAAGQILPIDAKQITIIGGLAHLSWANVVGGTYLLKVMANDELLHTEKILINPK
jgi:Beta-galactosidase/Secretion system C-terminal sorting domain/Putative Ig domain